MGVTFIYAWRKSVHYCYSYFLRINYFCLFTKDRSVFLTVLYELRFSYIIDVTRRLFKNVESNEV